MNNLQPKTLEIFYFDAGGGHRSAANALQTAIATTIPHWQVKLVNLQEVLQPADPMHRLTGIDLQDVYNAILKRGWTYGSLAMLRTVQKAIRLRRKVIEELLQSHWQQAAPDLVVSVIPNFNGPMFRALRKTYPTVPYVTIMTDFADCPPHFWQEKQDQYIVCGTDIAVQQAREAGYSERQIYATSGMILKPGFYAPQPSDRAAERIKLNLAPNLPTALIMFGGYGAKTAAKIVRRFKEAKLPVQSIVLCGNNKALLKELQGKEYCHAVGFTDQVPYYMHLADFFIGKPGPGSISEALHMGLPVIIERNSGTMPQEIPNADWVGAHDLGIIVNGFKRIADATRFLLDGDLLKQFRERACALNNRAIYEVPDILHEIMAQTPKRIITPIPVRGAPRRHRPRL